MESLQSIFQEQKQLINHFFDNLDFIHIQNLVNHIQSCNGTIFVTGMGKSGIIATNISQMLVSTGIRAMFLDPVNALHGDLGVVRDGDLLLLFSKSGQSTELVQLITPAKMKGAYLIAVVSNPNSLIAEKCDDIIVLPLLKELCPFDMAPTTSTIIQLILGNTIVAHLMRCSGLTREDYALNHPAGRIGKRLTMRVSDVMIPISQLALCKKTDALKNTLVNMSAKKCGNLLVVDNSLHLIGIFTDGDLRRALQLYNQNILNAEMQEIMSLHPYTIEPDAMAYTAMLEMERVDENTGKKAIKELPVVSNNILVGLIRLHDLVLAGL